MNTTMKKLTLLSCFLGLGMLALTGCHDENCVCVPGFVMVGLSLTLLTLTAMKPPECGRSRV